MLGRINWDKVFASFGRDRSHKPDLSEAEKKKFYGFPNKDFPIVAARCRNKIPERYSVRRLHKRFKGNICDDLKK